MRKNVLVAKVQCNRTVYMYKHKLHVCCRNVACSCLKESSQLCGNSFTAGIIERMCSIHRHVNAVLYTSCFCGVLTNSALFLVQWGGALLCWPLPCAVYTFNNYPACWAGVRGTKAIVPNADLCNTADLVSWVVVSVLLLKHCCVRRYVIYWQFIFNQRTKGLFLFLACITLVLSCYNYSWISFSLFYIFLYHFQLF